MPDKVWLCQKGMQGEGATLVHVATHDAAVQWFERTVSRTFDMARQLGLVQPKVDRQLYVPDHPYASLDWGADWYTIQPVDVLTEVPLPSELED